MIIRSGEKDFLVMDRILHPTHARGGIAKPTDELRRVEDYRIIALAEAGPRGCSEQVCRD